LTSCGRIAFSLDLIFFISFLLSSGMKRNV
jgi:hypothetical protein